MPDQEPPVSTTTRIEGLPIIRESTLPEIEHERIDTPITVSYLAELAAGRDVLEFGVGSGRLAIPLAKVAKSVVGIDISHQALQSMGDDLPTNLTVVESDVATWRSDERFHLVLCVFNLLLLFPSQRAQLAVIRNAARHLTVDGFLIVENIYPPLRALEDGSRTVSVNTPNADMAILLQSFDWKSMRTDQKVLYIHNGTLRTRRFAMRMIFPAEQDLMARIAGLTLVKRIANWRGTPWIQSASTPSDCNVISIYQMRGQGSPSGSVSD